MSRQLKLHSRDNKEVILDLWARMVPHYWTHKMVAAELGLQPDTVTKMIYRARKKGDPRAVYGLIGKPPW